jgi:hypothetical protein
VKTLPAYFTRHAKPNQLNGFVACSATYSFCRRYRYTLDRVWSNRTPARILLFIGLNPSTATHLALDPTVTRVVNRAKALSFDALRVCNLFAFRATDPREMRATPNPIGYHNDQFLHFSAKISDTILLGWGNHGTFLERDQQVARILEPFWSKCVCLDISNTGCPKHPLYLPERLVFRKYPNLSRKLQTALDKI